jgi:hypothetical protein
VFGFARNRRLRRLIGRAMHEAQQVSVLPLLSALNALV